MGRLVATRRSSRLQVALALGAALTLLGLTSAGAVPGPPPSDAAPTGVEGGTHPEDAVSPAPDGEYVLSGPRWPDRDLTWGIAQMTVDVSTVAQTQALTAAFAAWDAVSGLSFTRVADCGFPFNDPRCTTPDIRVLFGTGAHGGRGTDIPFDGPGGSVGHAFDPIPAAGTAAGDIHLDDGEDWKVDGRSIPDIQAMTMHELGHALGLRHPPNSECPLRSSPTRPTMCATTFGADRTLAPDDIAGIQALYGRPSATESCGGRTATVQLGLGELPTSGADVIVGTNGSDSIDAQGGNDIVCALGGDDTITLGPGDDDVLGGGGGDTVNGEGGADELFGQGGVDRLVGGSGGDRLVGGAGVDSCAGGTGRDTATTCEQVSGVP